MCIQQKSDLITLVDLGPIYVKQPQKLCRANMKVIWLDGWAPRFSDIEIQMNSAVFVTPVNPLLNGIFSIQNSLQDILL